MNDKTREYRQKIADAFISSLQESPGHWKQQWSTLNVMPQNAVTGRKYNGINRLYLTHMAYVKGYGDPRWCTFKQLKDQQWHLAKGSKGVQVEYWMPYDKELHKIVSWDAFNKSAPADQSKKYSLCPKYFTVFNASQIEGVPPLPEPERRDIKPSEVIDKISRSMGVIITNTGDKAFYMPVLDSVYLPPPEVFTSNYAYNATALHELSHATGHPDRLNRNLSGEFGSPSYAYEELIAEISSCFMSAELPVEQTPEHVENHKAYVQNWIQEIEKQPEMLMKAIKEAEKAATFLEYHAGLASDKEFAALEKSSMEVSKDRVISLSQGLPKQLNVIQGILCHENIEDGKYVRNSIRLPVTAPDPDDDRTEITIPVIASGPAAVSLLAHNPGDKINFVGELIKHEQKELGYQIKKIDDSGLILTATDKLLSDYIKTRDSRSKTVKMTHEKIDYGSNCHEK